MFLVRHKMAKLIQTPYALESCRGLGVGGKPRALMQQPCPLPALTFFTFRLQISPDETVPATVWKPVDSSSAGSASNLTTPPHCTPSLPTPDCSPTIGRGPGLLLCPGESGRCRNILLLARRDTASLKTKGNSTSG